MQYLLMLYTKESDYARLTPEQQQERRIPYMAYMEALKKAGVYLGADREREHRAHRERQDAGAGRSIR